MADDAAVDSAPAVSADVGTLDTGAETAETPETTTAEPKESEPDVFMSPSAQRLKSQQERAKQQTQEPKKRLPDSARAKIEADLRAKLEAETPWVKGLTPETGP